MCVGCYQRQSSFLAQHNIKFYKVNLNFENCLKYLNWFIFAIVIVA